MIMIKLIKTVSYGVASLVLMSSLSMAADETKPIREIKATVNIQGRGQVTKPTEVKDQEAAKKILSKELIEKLDFTKVKVLIFSWKGSGLDKLKYEVDKTNSKKVVFHFKAGRTRDLRPHLKVYVLKKDVIWVAPTY